MVAKESGVSNTRGFALVSPVESERTTRSVRLGCLAVGLGIDVVANPVLQFWLNRQIRQQARGYLSFCITVRTSERRPLNSNLLAEADEPKTSGISVDMTQ
jgi:hypothetical protein